MMFRRKTHNFIRIEGASDPEEPQRLTPRSPSEAIKPLAAPPPPPRMRRRRGFLSLLSGVLTMAVVLAFGAIFGIANLEQQVREPGPLTEDKVVVIPRNIGTKEITEVLRREGVINRSLVFRAYAYLNRQRGPLKAGEFLFKAGSSIDDAIDTLIEGKAILHSFTAPEGLTSEQIVARLRENDVLVGDITELPREGSLLPDTYKFERGMTRQQLVNLMQEKHRQALSQVWTRKAPDLPIRTPQELLILASIVEKETGRSDERSRVAGVFVNRLGKRMKLQSDPTIVYGLVGGKGTLGRGITRSEIDKATPYNTYVIEGLPPGPIANPGRASLEAAANPARTKDLYFVADGSGGHAFADSLDQHQRNVVRWRQIERSRAAGEGPVDRAEPPPLPGDAAPAAPAPGAAPSPRAGNAPAQAGAPATPAAPPRTAPARGQRGAAAQAAQAAPIAAATIAPAPAAPAPATPARPNPHDASEGTSRDPLLNKNFDLTTPKTVPLLRTQ